MADRVAADFLAEEPPEFAPRDRLEIRHAQQDEVLEVRELFRLGAEPRCKADGVGEILAGAVLPAAGDRHQLVRPAAQLVANIVDDAVEVAVAPDHPGQDLARHRLGRGKNHRLDPAHPFAPAQLGQFGIEPLLRLRTPAHVRARTVGRWGGRSARARRRAPPTAQTGVACSGRWRPCRRSPVGHLPSTGSPPSDRRPCRAILAPPPAAAQPAREVPVEFGGTGGGARIGARAGAWPRGVGRALLYRPASAGSPQPLFL